LRSDRGGAAVLVVEFNAMNDINTQITAGKALGFAVSTGIALYVGVAGGVAAAVGGVLGLTSKR
jgi:hypothetical protein